ncbi:MAG: aminoacyl-tRNA hydrolase [Alphaproteobacteria bacterium]|nr:aminoacyl-tRNA hydrolase [Alphaproteobacteria bacterium]
MWLLVGLGNPGEKYAANRHNIGFVAVDHLADRYGFPPFRAKFQGLVSEGRVEDTKVVLLKPQTFMNESGRSVAVAAKFFKIPPERIIVFHDELDIPPATIKVKKGGGHAGHNGLRSIDAHLGTRDYGRVRLGIGHPGDKTRVHGYVLSDFSKAEQPATMALAESVARHAPFLLATRDSDFVKHVMEDQNHGL